MIMKNAGKREKEIFKVTLVGSFTNAFLVIIKLLAGILGNSAAMVADAIHSISDFATDIAVLVFVKISGKPKDKSHDYGHGKYETIATTLIGLALFVVAIFIFCWCFQSTPKRIFISILLLSEHQRFRC